MSLPVTLVAVALAAFVNIWLAVRCVRYRLGRKVLHGDGGDPVMQRRMRAHANFVEYAPFVLFLIGGIEFARGTSWWLWLALAVFLAARIAHPLGMERDGPNPLRAGGAVATWLLTVALAVWALAIVVTAPVPVPTHAVEMEVPPG